MTDRIIIEGTAGTSPQLRTIPSGRQVANLRVASTLRRQDPSTGQWSDAGTNWYSVAVWGDLANHVVASIRQGDPVLLAGRLRIATWGEGERQGTAVEVDADVIGHSLRFGTATFQRRSRAAAESAQPTSTMQPTSTPQPPPAAEPAGIDDGGWAAPGTAGQVPEPASTRQPALAGVEAEVPF